MTDRDIAEIVCRALIAIVAAIRKRYGLPEYKGIQIVIVEAGQDLTTLEKTV